MILVKKNVGLISADPIAVKTQLDLMARLMPKDVFNLFLLQIDELLSAGSVILGLTTLISIGLVLWLVSTCVAALILRSNAIFDRPNRFNIQNTIVALMLTTCLIGIAIIALLKFVVAPILLAVIQFETDKALMFELVRWSIVMAVLVLRLGLLHRYGPNRRYVRVSWITLGVSAVFVFWLTPRLYLMSMSQISQHTMRYTASLE